MDKSDVELIESFLDGGEGAFNEIVERHKKRIYYAAYRMVKNHEDAMDLSQEVFIRAYKSIRHFNKSSSLYTWLYRITINLSINHIKRESHYEKVDMDKVTLESLIEKGLVTKNQALKYGVKILGNSELEKELEILVPVSMKK